MNDCENEVFDRVSEILYKDIPAIDVASEYIQAPSIFPHVSIVMADNPVVADSTDGQNEMSRPLFEVNIFSNKTGGKKTECKSIAKVIDRAFFSLNFRRMSITPVPNMQNATIYRIVARYRAATDGKFFYRR